MLIDISYFKDFRMVKIYFRDIGVMGSMEWDWIYVKVVKISVRCSKIENRSEFKENGIIVGVFRLNFLYEWEWKYELKMII